MGICQQRPSPTPASHETTVQLLSEIQRNRSILRLQELEVTQQTSKSSLMLQQLSVLILDKDQEGLVALRPVLEQGEEELSAVQETVQACKSECESLSLQLYTLQTQLENAFILPSEPSLETIQTSLTALHNQLTQTHRKLKEVEEDIASARQLRQAQEAVRLQAVQKRTSKFEAILRRPVHWLADPVVRAFLIWRIAVKQAGDEPQRRFEPIRRIASEVSNSYAMLTDMEEDEEGEFQVALDDEARWLVEGSPLNHPALTVALETAQTLDKDQLGSLLSGVFAAKLASDQERRKQGSEPLLFPHFLLAHFSAQPQANDRLAQLVRSVAQRQSKGSKQGLLWSSLLHLDVKTPALSQISQNLSLVIPAFRSCASKCSLNKSVSLLDERAYLADVFNMLMERMATDSRSGEEIINLLRPSDVSKLDYTFFRLLHCMRLQNVDSLGLFRNIDRAGKGRIEIQQLAKGVKDCLGAWVPESDIMSLLEQLDTNETGEISRLKFTQLSYKRYYESEQSAAFTVSLQSFLLCLVTATLSKAALILQRLKETLNWTDLQELTQSEFCRMVKSAYQEYTSLELGKVWAVAANLSGSTGSLKAAFALRAMLRYPPTVFCDSLMCKMYADCRDLAELKISG